MGTFEVLLSPHGESVGDLVAAELSSERWAIFRGGVAFAKLSGVKHLDAPLRAFVANGARCIVSVGVDQGGTSFEALSQLLGAVQDGGSLFVVHEDAGGSPTFHPKVYLFADDASSPRHALVVVGSANLTEGGLYSNHEASIAWRPDLVRDAKAREALATVLAGLDRWSSTTNGLCIPIDVDALLTLHHDGKLPTEKQIARTYKQRNEGANGRRPSGSGDALSALRRQPKPKVPKAPDIGLPAVVLEDTQAYDESGGSHDRPTPRPRRRTGETTTARDAIHQVLVIDINQREKTECYLAKAPVDEDPNFFGWPTLFTGLTTPKSARGVGQPQREPWPIVDIVVRDGAGRVKHQRPQFPLRMNNYVNARPGAARGNQDMRLGVPAEVLRALPEGCLLRMRIAPTPALDYRLEFLAPGSRQWTEARAIAIRQLPNSRRKFGWA